MGIIWNRSGEKVRLNPSDTGVWRSLASAFDWGSKGRRFKSCHPDLQNLMTYGAYLFWVARKVLPHYWREIACRQMPSDFAVFPGKSARILTSVSP